MAISTKVIGISLICLFSLPLTIEAQHFFDSGKGDHSYRGLQYDADEDEYYFVSFSSDLYPYLDSGMTYQKVKLDSSLQLSSVSTIQGYTPSMGEKRGISSVENWPQGVFLFELDVNDQLNDIGLYRTTFQLGQLQADSLLYLNEVTPDSTYGILARILKKIGDTVVIFADWYEGKPDWVFREGLIKYNVADHSVSVQDLPDLFTTNPLTGDSAFVRFTGDIVELSNGDWLATAFLNKLDSTSGSVFAVRVNRNFSQVKQAWSLISVFNIEYDYCKIWVDGNTVYVVGSGWRRDHRLNQTFYDYSIETFDLQTTDPPVQYHYELRDSTLSFKDIATVSYFNGEYFVLGGFSDFDPSFIHTKYSLELLSIDTSFRLVNHKSITDSTSRFAATLRSILPHPDSSGKVIYSGMLNSPGFTSDNDLFWGVFPLRQDLSLHEPKKLKETQVHVYPNPGNGDFTLLYRGRQFRPYEVTAYSTEGKKVKRFRINQPEELIRTQLAPGTYHLTIETEHGEEYHQVIVR